MPNSMIVPKTNVQVVVRKAENGFIIELPGKYGTRSREYLCQEYSQVKEFVANYIASHEGDLHA